MSAGIEIGNTSGDVEVKIMKYIILTILLMSTLSHADTNTYDISMACINGNERACDYLQQLKTQQDEANKYQRMQAISQALYNLSDGIQRAQQGPDMGPMQFQQTCQQIGSITRCR